MCGPSRDKGSKRHVLDLVHSPTFESVLNGLLAQDGIYLANPDHRRPSGRSTAADWREYTLENYLRRHPLGSVQMDRKWWIKHKGRRPQWDLLCHIVVRKTPGLLLVEAKAHESELAEQDKKRNPHPAKSASLKNDAQIRQHIAETNDDLDGLGVGAFALSADHHYQLANRLAYLNKLASLGIPTVLLYLGWLQSPDWPVDYLRDAAHWDQVMSDYMKDVVPATFPGQVFQTPAGGSMLMLIRSLPV